MHLERLRRPRTCHVIFGAFFLVTVTGCPGDRQRPFPPEPQVLPPVSLAVAVNALNDNTARLQGTIQARNGHARGYFTDRDRRTRNYDLDAALLIYPPRCLRMDLAMLGKSQLVFGSNETRYWVVQPGSRALSWGRHDQTTQPKAGDLLIRPDLLVEAVGFNTLPADTLGAKGPLLRNAAGHQEIIYLDYDNDGQGFITKEYWISRSLPRVLERIVFRDSAGTVAMDSRLSEYKPIEGGGAVLPHRIQIDWPATKSRMLFTAGGWRLLPDVPKDAPSFIFPLDRGDKFDQIVDVDVELEHNFPTLPDLGNTAPPDNERRNDSAEQPTVEDPASP
jgi:hypothetical protein